VPRCKYFTDGEFRVQENQKGRFLTSIRSEICYHSPNIARVSDDHAQIPGQIDLKVEAFALCLALVQVRSLHNLDSDRVLLAWTTRLYMGSNVSELSGCEGDMMEEQTVAAWTESCEVGIGTRVLVLPASAFAWGGLARKRVNILRRRGCRIQGAKYVVLQLKLEYNEVVNPVIWPIPQSL
jgi:hypothetical protein